MLDLLPNFLLESTACNTDRKTLRVTTDSVEALLTLALL